MLATIMTYFLMSTVTKVNYKAPGGGGNNQVVCVETKQGNYLFEGNGFKVGNSVILFMGDNGTPEDVKDDVIYDALLQ